MEKIRSDVKRSLDVWGYQGPAIELMRRIKHEFDPDGLLNPGRFVGGI
ncbi:MAG: FAD-linked oxidase C-terminal domain-containing protein [Acidobacteriota bacterium]